MLIYLYGCMITEVMLKWKYVWSLNHPSKLYVTFENFLTISSGTVRCLNLDVYEDIKYLLRIF